MALFNKLLGKFLIWRVKHIRHRQFLLFLSIVVGILGGLAAILLKNIVHHTNDLLTKEFTLEGGNLLFLAYPLLGILLTVVFVRYIIKDNIGHGISKILFSISRKNSILKSHNNYSSMLGATLTCGFGGSVGLEAPIVLTGSSIGSNLGRMLHLNYKTRTLLIGCGAAAAIAGIFKAPIAAMVFALEVLMLDLTMSSIVPLLISAVTGATVANFLLGKQVLFNFTLKDPFVLSNIPFYIILGILMGFVSAYFTKSTEIIEKQFNRIKNPFHKIVIGGVFLGILIFLLPPLYGEGYETLKAVLGGAPKDILHNSLFFEIHNDYWLFILFMIAVTLFKVVAMAITTGSGGVGGVFAPSLFMGGVAGFAFAEIINAFKKVPLSASNFGLVGMAGMIAGVMAAPLTAIFLIAEITSGYELFIPLILTSTISYLTAKGIEPHSIYTKRLAKRGELITHHKDKAILTLMKLGKIIETDFKTIHPHARLGDLVKVVSKSRRNIFPVVDEENKLLGVVLLDNIREIIFNPEEYDQVYVYELMTSPPAQVSSTDSMEKVMRHFELTGAWNLPVIDNGKYLGFISKSKIFSAYRRMLINFTDE